MRAYLISVNLLTMFVLLYNKICQIQIYDRIEFHSRYPKDEVRIDSFINELILILYIYWYLKCYFYSLWIVKILSNGTFVRSGIDVLNRIEWNSLLNGILKHLNQFRRNEIVAGRKCCRCRNIGFELKFDANYNFNSD